MRCINCDREARYNRALVDTFERERLGGVCRDCEDERFGRLLGRLPVDDGVAEQCSFCDRTGRFALPLHKLDIDCRAGTESVDSNYCVERGTPRFCEAHLRLVAPPDRVAAARELRGTATSVGP